MSVVGVIEQFITPPLGLCTLEALPGNPYSNGTYGFSRVRGPLTVDAFGIAFDVISAPAGYGLFPGPSVNRCFEDLVQLGTFHRMLSGTLVCTAQLAFQQTGGVLMFDRSFPYVINAIVAPGLLVDFSWVLLL